jgi:hypothetical protein
MASIISAGTTSGTALNMSGDTSGALQLATNGTTTAVTIDTSQNVGIGTTSPSEKLDVQSSGDLKARVYTSGTTVSTHAGLALKTGSYEYLIQNLTTTASSAGALRFYDITAGSERMRIDSSGNLLVAQTSQTGNEKFGVTQSAAGSSGARFHASNASYTNDIVQISCARSGATTEYNAFTVFDNNTTLKMLIRPNGNLLNSNNSYGSLSDISLKENIVDATPKLDGLMQVKVRNYNLKDDVNKTKQIGVIAQELETVFPSMIETDGDGIKAVKYSVFVPMLIKAIQELKAINDTQAETINALTARIVALEQA